MVTNFYRCLQIFLQMLLQMLLQIFTQRLLRFLINVESIALDVLRCSHTKDANNKQCNTVLLGTNCKRF
jgi:hypothetical protein